MQGGIELKKSGGGRVPVEVLVYEANNPPGLGANRRDLGEP